MAISTYAEAQTVILDWSSRSALSAMVPDAIIATEAIVNYGDGDPMKDASNYIPPLRVRDMITTGASVTVTSGSGSLPNDFLEPVRASTSLRVLEYATPDWYLENYPSGQSTDPSFYTVLGSSLYSGTDVTLDYYAKVPALASTDPNWLLTKSPMVYVYGGLYHLYIYDKDGEKAAAFRGLFSNALDGLRSNSRTSTTTRPARRSSMVAW